MNVNDTINTNAQGLDAAVIRDGGPAFPMPYGSSSDARDLRGMSLRDYFAARAMPEFCRQVDDAPAGLVRSACREVGVGDDAYALVARRAYELADRMIAERSRRTTK